MMPSPSRSGIDCSDVPGTPAFIRHLAGRSVRPCRPRAARRQPHCTTCTVPSTVHTSKPSLASIEDSREHRVGPRCGRWLGLASGMTSVVGSGRTDAGAAIARCTNQRSKACQGRRRARASDAGWLGRVFDAKLDGNKLASVHYRTAPVRRGAASRPPEPRTAPRSAADLSRVECVYRAQIQAPGFLFPPRATLAPRGDPGSTGTRSSARNPHCWSDTDGNLRLRQHPAAAAQVPRRQPRRVRHHRSSSAAGASSCRWCRRT